MARLKVLDVGAGPDDGMRVFVDGVEVNDVILVDDSFERFPNGDRAILLKIRVSEIDFEPSNK